MPSSVTVRMYDVGFGDAFLVTVTDGDGRPWRMLVDCGVHMHGASRPIRETVAGLVEDLRTVAAGEAPHLDVVVATHRHADHISGFSEPAWEEVSVGEVWVPFVEDLTDEDTAALRGDLDAGPRLLLELIEEVGRRLAAEGAGALPPALAMAESFALNARSNATAMNRLLGREGLGFAAPHRVRYLPDVDAADNAIDVPGQDATVHVLGPPRDAESLRRMEPPAQSRWLRLAAETATGAGRQPLFNPGYTVAVLPREHRQLRADAAGMRLDEVANVEEVLAAASVLERAVNNTSLFFVLRVGRRRLLFPGDAQHGAWQHVLDDPTSRALVSGVDLYKIGHHGSHNATPKEFVAQCLAAGAYAMLPWGLVERWQDTIPKAELMTALRDGGHHVVRADERTGLVERVAHDPDGRWSEVSLPVD